MTLFHASCAIRHYDAKTDTEHVWGFTHVKMRVAAQTEAAPSIATQTEFVGFGLGFGADDAHLGLGWNRRTRITIPDDTSVSLEWPTTELFDVRIGSKPPAVPPLQASTTKP